MFGESSHTHALLEDLNEPQRQAVTHVDGPLLVLAGPGSGKTRVITRRAAYLVHQGVMPRNILAITFTNKAADEMRQRVAALGVDHGMWVYTFHALGVRLIREFGPLARVQPGFTIYDDTDQKRLIKEAMQIAKISDQMIKPEQALSQISSAKNRLETPEDYANHADYFDKRMIAQAYAAYEQLLEQRNAVDFDDLLMRVAIVLRDNPEITERLNIRFRYVLIDEYQDTNHAQYLIASSLARHTENICATGDPDQSVYAWRGADISNILEFEQDYPEAKIVRLEENYRSTKMILRVASQLIANNRRRKHKDLWTHNAEGEPVRVWQFREGRDEADRIADTIAQMHTAGRDYSDMAIMYRVNAISRGIEEAFRLRGIPYRIARGLEFYNRKEIRDALAYLRVIVNPADNLALLRIINTPARGIGATSIKRLTAYAEQTQRPLMDVLRNVEDVPQIKSAAKKISKFVELLDAIARGCAESVEASIVAAISISGLENELRKQDEIEGEDRLANVGELVTAGTRYDQEVDEPTLEDFLQRVTLTSDQDAIDESADAVLLLTLHAAKGLEFPVVFMVGLEQGMLPHERSLSSDGDIEEERRLCFVGFTRARQQLFVSLARQRFLRGQLVPRAASQFIGELPDDACIIEQFGLPNGDPRSHQRDDGLELVMEDDSAPLAKRTLRRPSYSSQASNDPDEVFFDVNDEPPAPTPATSEYADWQTGTLVQHESYGVGQIQWIKPGPGQTRASIRFAGYGEKVFVLEFTPITRVGR
jgi:DNA helicase-2/ATP-dependent DNA helicase PcrA